MEKSRATEIQSIQDQLLAASQILERARRNDEILSVLKPLYINIRNLKTKLKELLK